MNGTNRQDPQPRVKGRGIGEYQRLQLDRASEVPLYQQLAEHIRQAIHRGALAQGSRLGNELDLAERFGISRPTTRRAIQELVAQGLVVRKRGVGTQVIHDHINRPLRLTSLFEDLAQDGKRPETKVLVNQLSSPPPEVAQKLLVKPHESVLRLRRLRLAGGEPLAILENFLPAQLSDIGNTDLTSHGLYEAIRAAGVRMRVANQLIGAREGTEEECRLLDEPPLSPMVTMERLTLSDSGRPVEWGRHVYRASRYEFTMTLVGK